MTELLGRLDAGLRTQVLFTSGDEVLAGEILATGGPDEIVASLRDGERAVVVLPFDPGEAAIAHRVGSLGPSALPARCGVARREVTGPVARNPTQVGLGRRHVVVEEPSAETYADRVGAALTRIDAGELDKVVLGRGLRVVSTPPLDAADVLDRLLETRPGRYVFAVPLADGILLGGSPELLVRRAGLRVTSLPLAGSVPRVADTDEDTAHAEALRGSVKDLAEHRYVVDQILDALAPVTATLSAPDRPELLATDTLWHLATPIEATLAPRGGRALPTALDLARLLHPTPAVAGVP
ncbi:MAG: chorismate-binding protein, partial [Nocardioides sp.]|uniref:chorismate-binding protein n=1 Tax=Nocardioides sp. TaxID=35761 RepID=UPI0039E4F311